MLFPVALAAPLLSLSVALGAPILAPAPGSPSRIDHGALRAAIDDLVAGGVLSRARVGICVLSLESGETLYAHDADALLNPASNVKLFTTAAALSRLGPDYRFETEVWAAGGPPGGAARTLAIRGKGDPSLTTERLWALAGELHHRGVQAVRDILVDETFFDGEREAPGYDQEQGDRAYLAPAGPVSLNFNTIAVHVDPGARVGEPARVELEPPSEYLEVLNRTSTGRPGGRGRIAAHTQPAGARERVAVTGRIPLGGRHLTFWRKVDDPALYFGLTLKRMLELRGVRVSGRVRRAAAPPEAKLLLVAESEPLAEIVRRLNKGSSNFMAEQVLKTLGAEVQGPPGSWRSGIAAGEEALEALGLPRGSYVWKNGSGLNDTNRFSARQTASLLRELWRRFPLMAEFVGSLPVAGRDGTVRFRMEGTAAEGRLRAKTGTLEGIAGLSGYVESGSGQRLAFAILVNDYASRPAAVVRAVDAIGALLAEAGGAPAAPAAPPPAGALSELRSRAATYYRLGLAADRRNVPFLRSALRTERDPVVRLSAAEAAYLSDPDSDTSRRAFLEAVVTDRESLSRLRELAGGPDLPAPVVGSLADIAAEGNAEAVARFLELAPAAAGDEGLEGIYAEALDEVARNAPDEMAAGLRAAAPEAAEAALGALAGRLARGAEAEHPLLSSLRASAGDADEARAGPARELERRLAERLAQARGARRPAASPPAPEPAAEPRPGG
jgi:D-alanyl-D-alanine carboxypeptidase/D-alanyl-D-alanine-endopeptidase (penicillin-binding protein 4)